MGENKQFTKHQTSGKTFQAKYLLHTFDTYLALENDKVIESKFSKVKSPVTLYPFISWHINSFAKCSKRKSKCC
jgi:hypothetical protein